MPHTSADEIACSAVKCVFEAVARREDLHRRYVLKGGLALRWAYGSPRRSNDLDFNAVAPVANTITEETSRTLLTFSRSLDSTLREVTPTPLIEHVETADIKLSAELPALLGQVIYTAIDDGWSGAIPMQVILSEIICATEVHEFHGIPLHVASLEDIVAEKLKALLQQATRETVRSSDVYDLWFFTSRAERAVRAEDVTPILLEKRKQWPTMPVLSKHQYRTDAILAYSQADYEKIADHLEPNAQFVPFKEAYDAILAFVDRLQLPD